MNYLRAENLAKSYGDRTLFSQLTFSIEKGDKIALIARNGTGKTNLLHILAGVDQSDGIGKVVVDKNIQVGFLPQEPNLNPNYTIWETLFNSNNALLDAIANYESVLLESESNHSDAVMKKLELAMEKMDQLQAWDYESRIKQILSKLGISDMHKKAGQLSGGQKKRLALAQILIHQPHLLILDEPTNHLDIAMIEWLEGYLKSIDVTLFLVTHDRYFLDAVCNEIIELDAGKLYTYKGNYGYFLEKKQERTEILEREIDKAKNLYRKELEWIRKQPKARGTKQKARVEAFETTKEKAHQKIEFKQVELGMKMQRLGKKIIECKQISKSFNDQLIIDNFSYTFKPGERIGIIGKNGVGKSTFLNVLLGHEKFDSGNIEHGDTVLFGNYAQVGPEFNPNKRVIEVVKDIAEYVELEKGEQLTASQLCKRFLFDDKTQYNFVGKLSGGEKRRLFLLTILIKNPNFLILDEPTNDLDIETLNVLEDFLELFKGCLIIVTHDRYFMDKLVDYLFVFEGNGKIRFFNGNYQDYLNELEEATNERFDSKQPIIEAKQLQSANQTQVKKKLSFKEQQELDKLNSEIPELEKKKSQLLVKLNQGSSNHEELIEWSREMELLEAELEEKSFRWLDLSE